MGRFGVVAWISASAVAVAGAVAVASSLGVIGADARWLVALGAEIVETGSIPRGVPFAAAPSEDWPNVLVLAELVFHALDALGDRGLLLAQLLALATGFAVLARDARLSGASDAATGVILLVVVIGALAAIVAIRLQLFSLALFPVLLLLLRSQTREPSRRVWLLVPLFALWGNLHGAVLVGLAVATAYLAFERARSAPVTAVALWLACGIALFANPALERTVSYYRGVLQNEAARRGVGLWEPLDLGSPLDLVFLAAAVSLIAFAVRGKLRLWELVAIAGLGVLTLRTERSGVWLLFATAAPAARALGLERSPRPLVRAAAGGGLALLIVLGVARGPIPTGASERTLERALSEAGGTAILAEPALAEQVAASGGRVWLGNPLDAFRREDQALYLDWAEGLPDGDATISRAPRAVLVARESAAHERAEARAELEEIARDERSVLYRVGR